LSITQACQGLLLLAEYSAIVLVILCPFVGVRCSYDSTIE